MKKAALEIMVDDIERSVDWYTRVLEFKENIRTPQINPVFVSLSNGNVDIMLYKRDEFVEEIPQFKDVKIGGSFALYITIEDIQSLYDTVQNQAKVIQELHKTNYGSTEFSIEDPNGYVLMFTQVE